MTPGYSWLSNLVHLCMPSPRLGILWFVPAPGGGSRLVELSSIAEDVQLIGGFRTLEMGHVDYWPAVVRHDPTLREVPYEAYPRGRANWREDDDTWLLLLDRKLHRAPFIDLVVATWSLPRDRLEVMADPHYRSSRTVELPRS